MNIEDDIASVIDFILDNFHAPNRGALLSNLNRLLRWADDQTEEDQTEE